MTPLSTPLKRNLKPLANNESSAALMHIELQPSILHARVIKSLCAMAIVASITTQMPWAVTAFMCLWTFLAYLQWRHSPQTITSLIDQGDSWQLTSPDNTVCVCYQHTEYCTAHLIVIAFKTQTGRKKWAVIWRDAVTPAAFSWLAARMTLSQADTPIQNVATSSPTSISTFLSRPDH